MIPRLNEGPLVAVSCPPSPVDSEELNDRFRRNQTFVPELRKFHG